MGSLSDAFNFYANPKQLEQSKTRMGSANIWEGTPLNVRSAIDAATMIPVAGDAISGGLAIHDYLKGDYGSAAMNALGVLPFIGGAGMLKPGKYPEHGWNIRGKSLVDEVGQFPQIPGDPLPHQNDVKNLVEAIKEKGLLPYVDVDKGGSVYVSAFDTVKNADGTISKEKKPQQFGKSFSSGFYSGKEPYQVRFADHGQFYSGPTMSIDPISENTIEQAKQMLEHFLGNGERPRVARSYITPATGEQRVYK